MGWLVGSSSTAIGDSVHCFWLADLVCVALKTEGQTGKSLISGTSLCDNGEVGGRARQVSASELDTVGITTLVLE